MAIYLHLILTYTGKVYAKYIKKSVMHHPYTKEWKISRFACKRQGRGNNLCGYYVVDYMLTFQEDMSDVDDFEVRKNWLVFFLISIRVNGLIRLILC